MDMTDRKWIATQAAKSAVIEAAEALNSRITLCQNELVEDKNHGQTARQYFKQRIDELKEQQGIMLQIARFIEEPSQ